MKKGGVYDADILRLRAEGHSVKEVARLLGINHGSVSKRCKKLGVNPTYEELEKYDTRYKDVQSVLDRAGVEFDYVEGYVNKRSPFVIRCRKCGNTISRILNSVIYKGVKCDICHDEDVKRRMQEKEEERERIAEEREQARIEREIEQERKRQERIHECPVCGSITDRPKYCSKECAKTAQNQLHEHARRIKIKNNLVDKDITLPSLYKRDGGVCYICGQKCLYDDFTVVNGTTICGDWYPSIDHVVPLAKGGEHSWKNVKLAHRRCNYLKSDQPLIEKN